MTKEVLKIVEAQQLEIEALKASDLDNYQRYRKECDRFDKLKEENTYLKEHLNN